MGEHRSLVPMRKEMPMDLSAREKSDFQVVDISGKINRLKDSIVLKSFVNGLIEKNHLHIALDLENVTYLDSGALNVLIYCHNMLSQKNGQLVLIAPNEYVQDVLEVVGLDKLVKIYSSKESFDNDQAGT
jgi:anti-anti-sigma factor